MPPELTHAHTLTTTLPLPAPCPCLFPLLRYFRKEAHAKTCSIMRIYRQAERAQEVRIGELDRKLEVEQVVHRETVEFLKHKHKVG